MERQSSKEVRHHSGPRQFARLSKSRRELSEIAADQSSSHHRQQWKNEHERFWRVGARSKISRYENARQLQKSRRIATHNSGCHSEGLSRCMGNWYEHSG